MSEFEKLEQLDELSAVAEMARRKGMSPEDYVRRVVGRMAHGKPAVEDEIADARSEAKKAQEKAEQAMAELRKRDEQANAARAQAEAQAYIDDYAATAAEAITEAQFPILSGLDADEVVGQVLRVADEYAGRTGVVPPAADVLAYLEQQETARLERIAQRAGYSRAPTAPPAAHAGTRPAPVTGAMASERGGTPTDWAALPERERVRRAGLEVFGPPKTS